MSRILHPKNAASMQNSEHNGICKLHLKNMYQCRALSQLLQGQSFVNFSGLWENKVQFRKKNEIIKIVLTYLL